MGFRVIFKFSGGVEAEGLFEGIKEIDLLAELSPFTSSVELWGDEIYFEIPVKLGLLGERREMSIGEIAYWPDGNCLCIFFGKTPLSRDDRPIAYSNVKPIGRITKGLEELKKVKRREEVEVIIYKTNS